MKIMNKKIILMNIGKVGATIIIITLFFNFILQHSPLITVSPDSVRFMHFWQTNVDQFKSEGGNVKSAIKAVFFSLKSSNDYDVNRGRFIQYIMHGIDGLTRWMLPSPMINVWMFLLLILNSALIAWVSTRVVSNPLLRLNLFCLGWLVLISSSFVISPAILLILYGKYVWVTFVLAFFLFKSKIMKVECLAAAAFSDEIGLFATMIITFLTVMRFILVYYDVNSNSGYSSLFRILRACFLSIIASFIVLFVFYGISAVVFNVGATAFRGLCHQNVPHVFQAVVWWSAVKGLLWRAEVLILGLSSGNSIVTTIVGLIVLGVIITGIWKIGRYIIFPEALMNKRFADRVREWLCDEKCYFYTFWVATLFLITFIVIPFGVGDYTHYSYPAAAVLAVLFIRALLDIWPVRLISIVLLAILLIHLVMLPRAIRLTYDSLSQYLFPDKTVSYKDINSIKRSVMDLRANGNSAFFNIFNNGQEINFNGIWFYSRIKGDGTVVGPYFPIQGTVRVLLWPDKIRCISNK